VPRLREFEESNEALRFANLKESRERPSWFAHDVSRSSVMAMENHACTCARVATRVYVCGFFSFFFFFFLKSNVYVKDYVHISLQARPGAARESISPPRASQRLSVKRTKEEKEKKKEKKEKKKKGRKKGSKKKEREGKKRRKEKKKRKRLERIRERANSRDK